MSDLERLRPKYCSIARYFCYKHFRVHKRRKNKRRVLFSRRNNSGINTATVSSRT